MKRILPALLFVGALLLFSFSSAQTPDANQDQRLLALVKEVQIQQEQMADNQRKIEEKLANLEETIRTARIYTKRER